MRSLPGPAIVIAAAVVLAGCISVEHLPPEDGGVDPALLAAAPPGSAGTLTWMSEAYDHAFEALVLEDLRRPGLFAEVRLVPVDGSGTPRGAAALPAPDGWVLSLKRSFDEGTGADFRGDFAITLLTLGIWPTSSSRHTMSLYRLRRVEEGASPGETIRVTDGYGAVMGLVALPMALHPDWEVGSAPETRRRRMADHLANEVLRAVLRRTSP